MRFKELNKTRKKEFVIYNVLGRLLVIFGAISKNLTSIWYGLFVIINSLHLQIDQDNDNIISDYEKICKEFQKSQKEAYLVISKAIKNKDIDFLNKVVEVIDEKYKD